MDAKNIGKIRTWVDGEDGEHEVGYLFRFRFRELVLFHQHVFQRPELELLNVPELSSVSTRRTPIT
jgi:hypothetical protein